MFRFGKTQLLSVGAVKSKQAAWVGTAWEDYTKRLRPYGEVQQQQVSEEPALDSKPQQLIQQMEAQRLQPFFEKAAYRVALSERGCAYSSEAFAQEWQRRLALANPVNRGSRVQASSGMIWVIGGPQGLHPNLLDEADWVVSLSSMTFPHTWVRLVWVEQLYRACRILNNEPYHK
jgi:23S rRNA (pseudouridine1915-N3)-methyltransferase